MMKLRLFKKMVKSVELMELQKDDIVVINTKSQIKPSEAHQLYEQAKSIFTDNKVVVLSQDIEIKIVRQHESEVLQ